jgi:hypothetical protein
MQVYKTLASDVKNKFYKTGRSQNKITKVM